MKDKIKQYLANIIGEAKEANKDALSVFVELKQIESIIKEGLNDLSDLALDEARLYGGKSFDAFGAKITIKASAGRWDFSNIKQVSEFENDLKAIKEAHKEAYKLSINGKQMIQDGELIEPAEFKAGKEIISVQLKL